MARIVVVTHEFDDFAHRQRFWKPYDSLYLLFDVLKLAERDGHSWRTTRGSRPLRGDVGILHTDCTVVPEDYLALAGNYRLAINFGAATIAKRKISGAVLSDAEPWLGPVIVKSDFNHQGHPETLHNRTAARLGRELPHPDLVPVYDYVILPSREDVPDHVRNDPSKVVERFVPELDEQGYAMRTWLFMGSRERCSRLVSNEPIIKGGNIVSRSLSDVPAEIRAERARLGFDYGKFDFVVHDDGAILLDANRTPGSHPALRPVMAELIERLAQGLNELINSSRRSS